MERTNRGWGISNLNRDFQLRGGQEDLGDLPAGLVRRHEEVVVLVDHAGLLALLN